MSESLSCRFPSPARTASLPDPRVRTGVRLACVLGPLLVLLVPALRGSHPWLGWGPLWLVGMPMVAWWALCHFRLPSWPRVSAIRTASRRRRPTRLARRLRARTLPARVHVA